MADQKQKQADPKFGMMKSGLILAFLGYTLFELVVEFFSGNSEGFTLPIFLLGVAVLGGGCIFAGILLWRNYRQTLAAPEEEKERDAEN